jgi:hypothetical protein
MGRLRMAVISLIFCMSTGAITQNNASAEYSRISDLLKHDNGPFRSVKVSKIVIIHLRTDVENYAGINPQSLRRLRQSELSLSEPEGSGLLNSLLAASSELKTATESPEHEVRWGILIIDPLGKEQAAMFLDMTGKYVQVGDARLQVQGKLLTWIKTTIASSFK